LRRFTLAELLDRTRQAARSRAEGVPYVRDWVLPTADCFVGEADGSAALDAISAYLPLGFGASSGVGVALPQPRCEEALRRSADALLEGYFDLLGLKHLAFGRPVDWHREAASGRTIPLVPWKRLDSADTSVTGDKKVVWELNRQQHLVVLARAYLHTGDRRYADAVAEHIVSWIAANPTALGINWVSSLDIAFRCMSWLWAIALVRLRPGAPALPTERIARALHAQGCHIESYLSSYFSPNTHLTGEALGLYYLGTCVPQLKRAARWRALGRSILMRQLEIQVHPDGVYFEQSSWYQRYTADFYVHFMLLAERAGEPLPARVGERVEALLDHLLWITRPDGTSPYIGDDDGGRLAFLEEREANDWRGVLSTGAAMYGRGDYKHVAGPLAEETQWLLGPTARARYDSIPAGPPRALSRAFVDGGYYVMRSAWDADASFLLADCGPHGTMNCGHAHADALSIEVAARGTTLLVDPGTFTYNGSPRLRDLFRSTAMHNTLTLDGLPSSVPAGPFKWKHATDCTLHCWHDHPGFTCFEGSHEGYMRLADPAIHVRQVLFVNRDYWLVLDRVEAAREHDCAVHFHLAADAQAIVDHATGRLEARIGSTALDIVYPEGRGSWSVAEGVVSPCYAAQAASVHATFTSRSVGPEALACMMLPRATDEPPADVRKLDTPRGRAWAIATPRFHDVVAWSAGALRIEGIEDMDCEWAWVRRSPGQRALERAALLHGTRFAGASLDLAADEPLHLAVIVAAEGSLSIDVVPPVGLRIRPPAGVERVIVNGRACATTSGSIVTLGAHDVPPLGVPRDAVERCKHVRH